MSPAKADELRQRRQKARGAIDPDAEPVLPPPAPLRAPEPQPEPSPAASGSDPRETREPRETRDEPVVSSSKPTNWNSTLDDPAVIPGRMQARSNYVEDTAFARYRAAVYWLARNPDAISAGVPENVSAGVNAFLEREASRLEKRFNAGNPFPATPEQEKRARSKKSGRR